MEQSRVNPRNVEWILWPARRDGNLTVPYMGWEKVPGECAIQGKV